MSDTLLIRAITMTSPEWAIAVNHKRERAFAMVTSENLFSYEETFKHYAAYKQAKGIGFHEERLRAEVGEGELLTWWRQAFQFKFASNATPPDNGSPA